MTRHARNLGNRNVSVSVSLPIRLLMKIHDKVDRINERGNATMKTETVSSVIRKILEKESGQE